MSLPQRPGQDDSPPRHERSVYRKSQSRRDHHAQDVDLGYKERSEGQEPAFSQHRRKRSERERRSSTNERADSHRYAPQSRAIDTATPVGFERKKSLIRPERNRIDPNHPNYHYRQHAAGMNVKPSTTGNDPVHEDMDVDEATNFRSSNDAAWGAPSPGATLDPESGFEKEPKKLTRAPTRNRRSLKAEKKAAREAEVLRPPTLWNVYCSMVTFWCPAFLLRAFGFPSRMQQRAWREKMGLISLILLVMGFVGFLTFGFTAVVCGTPPVRLRVNNVDGGYMIFHGYAYNLDKSRHPTAFGIRGDSNVLYDLPEKNSGKDGSFLFQNVNGKCKGLITASPGSDVPTDKDGNLGWYFPCKVFNQDGSSSPNTTYANYHGYQCHTSQPARDAFYGIRSSGEVYYRWEDVRNSSRNLAVYSGNVLDFSLLTWFNGSEVTVPKTFKDLSDRTSTLNQAVRGKDITHKFQRPEEKMIAECLEQIIKVGQVDTETVGCIASQVVLYVSLAFIISIVGAKFLLALYFQWFLSRKYAAAKTSQSSNKKKRNAQIEEWTNDIYLAPPRMTGDIGSTVMGSSDRTSKRGSTLFLPTTSRFSSPHHANTDNKRPITTTMASQQSTTNLSPPNPLYKGQNGSRMSLMGGGDDQSLAGVMSEISGDNAYGPAGFIHESVVPQPPPEWKPFGYPLLHTLCLVTTYSEGELGIRTTLDSIATTDYPNSHKTLLIICDGIIKGHGEDESTPDIVLRMMKDHAIAPEDVPAFSYVAVASGAKRHNMAKVYSGFYDYGHDSLIPAEKQQRVPMMCIVKCGTPDEMAKSKPGNRGKRDSQIILMSFLQKVMFDERMTELEFEMFNGLWKITGISPDFFETVLMVDADTKVFPDSLTHMVSAMVKDPDIMGLCGETKIANKRQSWVTAIQVFEYFISHHLSKSFESVFGGVTCLPGCFSMYRIKAPKGGQSYWVPILANPDVVEHYSENVVDTLHKKNLLLLGEDRYLSTLMLKTFPKRKQVFVPQAVCKTTVPDEFKVLLSQRRRWINSTIHNLMELVLVRDLCGTFCFSMQFVVFIDLIGTLVLPAAIAFTIYVGMYLPVPSPHVILQMLIPLKWSSLSSKSPSRSSHSSSSVLFSDSLPYLSS